jgi:arylformamidase
MTDPRFAKVDAELNTRARAPHYDDVNAAYAALSVQARARLLKVDGHAYGPHALEKLDLLRAGETPRAVMLWFHGGFWRSRDRADFHFIAQGFARRGVAMVAAGYPKCPEVRLERVVEAALAALQTAKASLSDWRLAGLPLLVGGHSAGAHLATMVALARPADVAGLLALSGLYDLEPVRHSFANAELRLDDASARALSPVLAIAPARRLPPAAFLVGAEETGIFHRQTEAMTRAWSERGQATLSTLPSADHYTILFALSGGTPSALAGLLKQI